MQLSPRPGPRPATSTEGPHRQLDQQAPLELWGRMVAEVFSMEHVVEGRSQVSPVTSRAVLFDDLVDVVAPATSLAPEPPLEPVHLHGVSDTSVHLLLPAERAQQVCDLGWGEPHVYADHDSEVMVYGPRDAQELQVMLGWCPRASTRQERPTTADRPGDTSHRRGARARPSGSRGGCA